MHKEIFTGVKVIAVARQVAAPFATYHLALHGAEVITIENPKEPDSMRFIGHPTSGLVKAGMSPSYLAQASNKRSITLNIASREGQEIFRKLASGADVLVENLVSGKMAKYGLGYDDLSAINPRLIYCSVTGYGQTGPDSGRAAVDSAIQAASGLMSLTGNESTGPMRVGFFMVDYATGYAGALAIVSALYHRRMTGEGQYIDVAMLDSAMTLAGSDISEAVNAGANPRLKGNGDGRFISNTYACKEGTIAIAATTAPRRSRFWRAIGREDILLDARFADVESSLKNMSALNQEILKTLAEKTAAQWEELLSEAGVPAMEVRSLHQAVSSPQIVHRGLMHEFGYDEDMAIAVSVPTTSYHFSKTPRTIHSMPPRIGQHTEEVLKGLGYAEGDIVALRQRNVI